MQGGLRRRGYRLERDPPIDLPPDVAEIVRRVGPKSAQVSVERFFALCIAIDYISEHAVPGAVVECGVFRGASMMAAALRLAQHDATDRELYLFDTFAGMPQPSERDVSVNGMPALARWLPVRQGTDGSGWALASLDEVRANMRSTGYPDERMRFVAGKVEDTIPEQAPDEIALLRLDTDWYESTRHELEHLFPRLVRGGVLIIDDYGHWSGARQAVDEYFAGQEIRVLLDRIDYTARIAVKQDG